MNLTRNILKLTITALAAAIFFAPMTADAGRFRGAGDGAGTYLIDTDGDGIGDTRPAPGSGMGRNAANFVDTDGNGLCDTYEAGGQQLLDGSGANASRGRGYRGGR